MSNTVPFRDLRRMLEQAGYTLERVNGSHHLFTKAGERPISVPVHSGKVKRVYQRKIEKALSEEGDGQGS